MGSRRWIGLGLAVVVVAVVVVVIAQSGGSGSGPLDAIAKAAEVTQREPGGRAVITATVKSSTTPEGITETGSMTFENSGRAEGELTAVGLSNGKEIQMMTISDDTTAYVSSDAFDSLPEGKKWMELDLSSAVKGAGPAGPASGGPEEGLKLLEKVQDSEVVGTEDIRGVPTTHYHGTPPTSDEVFGVKVDTSKPSIDVWIDAQGRIRRTQIATTTSVGDSGDSAATKMTMDFVEFGRVPKIELPPADEVFNATKLIESQVQSEAEGG
jgi:LppX/LprAFG-like lipoprotein